MQLKKDNENASSGENLENPGFSSGYMQNPAGGAQAGGPYMGGTAPQAGSPYMGGTAPQAGSPYRGYSSEPGNSPYPGGSPNLGNSPYSGGSPNPGNNPYPGNSPYPGGGFNPGNGPYPGGMQGSPYGGQTVIKENKFPVWLIIVIVLLIVGGIGYLVFDKLNTVFGKSKYIPGTLQGNTYTNEYFGVKGEFGDNWKLDGYAGGAEAEKNALNSYSTVQELGGQTDLSAEAIDISVRRTPYNIKESGTNMQRIMDYLEEEFKKQLTAQGYEIQSIKQDKMTIAGKSCDGFIITAKVGGAGTTVSMVQFYIYKGNYVSAFSAASTSEGKSKLILTNNFSEYTP